MDREGDHQLNIIKKYQPQSSMAKEIKVKDAAAGVRPSNQGGGFRSKKNPVAIAQPQSKLEGPCEGLKGFTFNCTGGRQSNQYNINIKYIAGYVGRYSTHIGYTHWTVDPEKFFTVPKPVDTEISISANDRRIWERWVDEYVKRDNKLIEIMETVFSLVVGQFNDYMVAKLEGLIEYSDINGNFDVIKLFKDVKGLTCQLEVQRYYDMALYLALKRYYTVHQGRETMNAQYLKNPNLCIHRQSVQMQHWMQHRSSESKSGSSQNLRHYQSYGGG
jgi:hypothetical protein